MELRAGYKQTEVGAIPEDWAVRPLLESATIRSGIAKNSNVAIADPVIVHYLRVANVQDGFLDLSEMSQIQVARSDLKRFAVLPGDVLMNEGGDLDKLGRGAMWHGEFNPCIHQNHVFVVRCNQSLLPEYLDAWTGTKAARRYFLLAGKQTTNLASINKTALGQLPVALPPPAEQRAIATALSDVDTLLAKIDQFIAKKRDLKQAAMQQLLTGQTRLPGFSGEWEVKRLGDLAETGSGGTPPSFVTAYYDGDVPWVSIADMTSGGKVIFATERNLTAEGLKNSAAQMFPPGTVLYAMYASIGECSIAGAPLCSSQAILGIRTKAMLDKDFLFYHLTSLKPVIKTMGQQGTQANLNAGMVRAFEIKLPKLAEQTAIASVLSDMDAELATLECRRDKTRALKQGMMQALLTGRIRLVGAN